MRFMPWNNAQPIRPLTSAKAGGSGTPTSAIDTTGATLLVATVAAFGSTSPTALTDSKLNIWIPLIEQVNGSQHEQMWLCPEPAVGTGHTFTYGLGGTFPSLCVGAYSGVSAAAFVSETGANGNAATIQPGSLTPKKTGNLFVTGLCMGIGTGPTIDLGFTEQHNDYSAGAYIGSAQAYLIETAIAAKNPTWNWTGSFNCGTTMAVFDAASTLKTTIPFTDSNIYFSPWNWKANGSLYNESNNTAAYLKTKFTGTSCAMLVDVSQFVAAGVQAGIWSDTNYPIVAWQVDGGSWTRVQLTPTTTTVNLGQNYASGTHDLFVILDAVCLSTSSPSAVDRWTTPVNTLRVKALLLDVGEATAAPTVHTKKLLVHGDSFGEGAQIATGVSTLAYANQARLAYPKLIADHYGYEFGTVCFASSGYQTTGLGGVPVMTSSWNLFWSGANRLNSGSYSPAPDYILCAAGFNDTDNAGLQSAVAAMIGNWRGAAPSAKIFIVNPPDNSRGTHISGGVTDSGDASTWYISTGSDILAANPSGSHLNATGQAAWAAVIETGMDAHLP